MSASAALISSMISAWRTGKTVIHARKSSTIPVCDRVVSLGEVLQTDTLLAIVPGLFDDAPAPKAG